VTEAAPAAKSSAKDPSAQLLELKDDPEALKAKAAELAAQASQAAEAASGGQAERLRELASVLFSVAESGDLSIITDKIAVNRPMDMGSGFSGLSGASGASMKWLEALLAEEEEEKTGEIAEAEIHAGLIDIKQIFDQLEELKDDPEALKAKAAGLAAQVSQAAETASGRQAKRLQELAASLSSVAEDGDLSTITAKMKPHGHGPMRAGGPGGPGRADKSGETEETDETENETETEESEESDEEISLADLLVNAKTSLLERLYTLYTQRVDGYETSSRISFSA
jgi:hypothetical protein